MTAHSAREHIVEARLEGNVNIAPGNRDIILQVVRGVRPWTDLQLAGITVTLSKDAQGYYSWDEENPQQLQVAVEFSDVATGLLKKQHDPEGLRIWAFVLSAGSFWTFSVDEDPVGDRLLEALRDASFGAVMSDDAIALAEQLVAESR